ncbi:MAG TPA: hypothetical protein VEI74_08065 [Candidatus Methylomirabilis sp.]|nr:hypothetical protein [Candidatus Methylomirabilis sp.]
MHNYFKRFERFAFVVLLLLTTCVGILGAYCTIGGFSNGVKWVGTSGLLATVTGVIQLDVSGLFEKILMHYGDAEKYPYGSPSYITREIIDNPDRPYASRLRNTCFFNARTGFWLIILGTMTQVLAVWL